MLKISLVVITILYVGMAVARTGSEAIPTKDGGPQARAALAAYSANLNSFPYYKLRFRVTEGDARTLEDALAGKIMDAKWSDKLIIKDETRELLRGLETSKDPKLSDPEAEGALNFLSNGDLRMAYMPAWQSADIRMGNLESHGGLHLTPMHEIGHRNRKGPDAMLREADKFKYTFVGMEDIQGQGVYTILFEHPHKDASGKITRTDQYYSLDPARGYLPRRHRWVFDGKEGSVTYLTHDRECSNQRWFPERLVTYFSGFDPPRLVREFRLLDLEVDKRPKPEDFNVVLPAGTLIKDGSKDMFRLKQEEKVGPDDLPRLVAMLKEKKTNPLMDTAIPRSSPYRWAYWAGGIMVGLGAVGYLVRRRMRAA